MGVPERVVPAGVPVGRLWLGLGPLGGIRAMSKCVALLLLGLTMTGCLYLPTPHKALNTTHITSKHLYRAVTHPQGWSGLPDYEIRGNQIFRTVTHLDGWSGLPDYEIRGDGKVYRAVTHPAGWGGLPDYEFRGDGKLYRAVTHPHGWGGLPDFEIR